MPTEGSEVLELLVRLRDQASRQVEALDDALGSVDRRTKRLVPTFTKLRTSLGRVSSVVFSLKGAIATLGLGALTKSFVDAASASENYRVRLVRLLGSVREGNRAFDVAAEFASKVAFEYEDILGSTTALSGVLKGGVDEIKQYLPIVADLAAVSGLSIEETTGQIIRLYSAGAGAADLFRERGILAMLGFQAGVSVSAEETRQTLIEAFESPTSKFRDAASDLGKTWTGLLSLLSDAIFQFKNDVADAGAFDFIKAGLAELLDVIREFRQNKEVVKDVSDAIVSGITGIIKAAAIVGDIFRGWQLIWQGLRGGFASIVVLLTEGLARVADFADLVRQKMNDLIGDTKQLAPILRVLPGPAGILGNIVANLEQADVKVGQTGESLREGLTYWDGIVQSSAQTIEHLSTQESFYSRAEGLIKRIRDRAEEYADAAKEGASAIAVPRPEVQETPGTEALLASQLNSIQEDAKSTLQALEPFYKQSLDKLKEYFAVRESTTRASAAKELEILQAQLESESNVDKRQAINDNIYSLRAKLNRDLQSLDREREEAITEHEENKLAIKQVFQDIETRLSTQGLGALQTQFRQEQAELSARQQAEIELLQEHLATKEELNQVHRDHELEMEQLLTEQLARQAEARLSLVASVAGQTSSILNNVFELTGKKNKELFQAAKIAAIAEATINVATGVTKAIAQGGYYGFITGALVAVKGAIEIAKIQSQSLAAGGLVEGYSPSSTSDNIPINATAGEYMQPVKSVKHYGLGIMKAIRDRSIPKALLSPFSVPIPEGGKSSRTHYATGGEITPIGGASGGAGQAAANKTNIVNVLDPQVFDQWAASTPGQQNVMNIMRENIFELRQIVFDNQS